ncbi:MAG: MarR family transcriptional regulator [Rhodospirillaceae bacterium]|nr:MarR family transcriptional regulator [Rhodospirillaceae bacterium]
MTDMSSARIPISSSSAFNGRATQDCAPCNAKASNIHAGRADDIASVARMTNLIDRLGRAVHCLQFSDGLNPAQWAVLRYLGRANRYSRTPTAISDYLGTTRGTMSQTIKALEGKGLIVRETNDRDRRAVLLNLTEQGEAILKNDPLGCVNSVARSLGNQLEEASEFLDRVVDCLQNKTDGLRYGVCAHCTNFCKSQFASDVHMCGLTGDSLSVQDSAKICVNYSDPAAS